MKNNTSYSVIFCVSANKNVLTLCVLQGIVRQNGSNSKSVLNLLYRVEESQETNCYFFRQKHG